MAVKVASFRVPGAAAGKLKALKFCGLRVGRVSPRTEQLFDAFCIRGMISIGAC